MELADDCRPEVNRPESETNEIIVLRERTIKYLL